MSKNRKIIIWLLVLYSWILHVLSSPSLKFPIGAAVAGVGAAVATVVTTRAKLVCFAPKSRQNDALLYSAKPMERRREAVAAAAALQKQTEIQQPNRKELIQSTKKGRARKEEEGEEEENKRRQRWKSFQECDGSRNVILIQSRGLEGPECL